jgi:hypothetical protein
MKSGMRRLSSACHLITSCSAFFGSDSAAISSAFTTLLRIMPFPFTFTLNIPGLNNPFLAQPALAQSRNDGRKLAQPPNSHHILVRPPRHISPCPSLSPPLPLARKRGWVPSTPEPSQAITSAALTRGYLDTPAKYRHMPQRTPEEETEDLIAGMSTS